jgi:hypothetical protein
VARRGPFGQEELERFVVEEWGKIRQAEVRRLVDTFEGRLRACIALDGHLVTKTRLRQQLAGEKLAKARREGG